MNKYHASDRLMPHLSLKDEWTYLVNETLAGEKAIVPLLNEILKQNDLPADLSRTLEQQLDEEFGHVRMYHDLVGREGLQSSHYDEELKVYVRSLSKVTLKLFALQGMLEGVALGALENRLTHWHGSPSYRVDLQAHEEEEGHIVMSHPYFAELSEVEGRVTDAEFRQVEKDVNRIFTRAFSAQGIEQWMRENEKAIQPVNEQSLNRFRRRSTWVLVRAKNEFLDSYRESIKCCA